MATTAKTPVVAFTAKPAPIVTNVFSSQPVDFLAQAVAGTVMRSQIVTFTAAPQAQWLYQRVAGVLQPRRLAQLISGVLTYLGPPLPVTGGPAALAVARPTLVPTTVDGLLYYYFVKPDGSWIRKTATTDLGIVPLNHPSLSTASTPGSGTIAGCLSAEIADPTKHHSGRIIQLDRTQSIEKRPPATNSPPDTSHPGYLLINGWRNVIWSGGHIVKEHLDLNGGVLPDQGSQPKIGFDDHQNVMRALQNSGHVYLEGLKLGGSQNFETLDIGGQFSVDASGNPTTYTIINCYFDRTRRFVTGAPTWQPSHAYTAGDPVANPNSKIVRALATFTSGTTYDAANWSAELAGANHDGGDIIQAFDGAGAINIIGCHFERSDYQSIFLKATDARYRGPSGIPGTIGKVTIAACTTTYAYPDVETNGSGPGGHNDSGVGAYREPLWISGAGTTAADVVVTDYVVHLATGTNRMSADPPNWVRTYLPGSTVVGATGTPATQTVTTVSNGTLVGSNAMTGGVLFLNDGIAAPQRATDAGLSYDPALYA